MTPTTASTDQSLKTKDYPIGALIFAEYNPRQLTKDQYKGLRDSIERFGLVDPIIVNKHKDRKNIVVGGHQRIRIAQDLGFKKIPCVEVELDADREKELNIRLNKNVGEWDYDALANNFDVGELTEWGFTDDELQFYVDEDENNYTQKIESPHYEPQDEKPNLSELYNDAKTKELIEEIDSSPLDKKEKDFLKLAAFRHTVFNYQSIADFYAHSNKEVQELMEDSALVIIDFNKAIENGYVKLSKEIEQSYLADYGE
jgi:hypothetical protein